MTKIEIICESCDEHYIIVTTSDNEPQFCPFCQTAIEQIDEDE